MSATSLNVHRVEKVEIEQAECLGHFAGSVSYVRRIRITTVDRSEVFISLFGTEDGLAIHTSKHVFTCGKCEKQIVQPEDWSDHLLCTDCIGKHENHNEHEALESWANDALTK